MWMPFSGEEGTGPRDLGPPPSLQPELLPERI